MRDQINRNNVIAEENINLYGHPAKEKFGDFQADLSNNKGSFEEKRKTDTCEERLRKIDQMDEIIQEDIENMKE